MNSDFALEIEKYSFSLPVMDELAAYLQESGRLSGQNIGWHCHLTAITAACAKVILGAGARLVMSEVNRDTTSEAAVAFMRELGAEVFLGEGSCLRVLERKPRLLADCGFVLTEAYLGQRADYVFAGSEITTSGISRLSEVSPVPLPVININDGQIKSFVENFHGVGDGLVDALFQLTGRMWSGRSAAVFGYGRVGAGVAHYLKREGAEVAIAEIDPVRQLIAHYDGFALTTARQALQECQLVVTATGREAVIGAADWAEVSDGAIIVNVGHWAQEVDVPALRKLAVSQRKVALHMEEFTLPGKQKIFLVGGGSPANVVLLSGSPEPTLIHLTTEVLCMNYLTEVEARGEKLVAGQIAVPPSVERQASTLALRALGLSG